MDTTSRVMMSVADEVTEAEVARAKAQLKASLVMNLESASSRADQIARQFLAFGEVPAIGSLIGKIDAVTPGPGPRPGAAALQVADTCLQRRRPHRHAFGLRRRSSNRFA